VTSPRNILHVDMDAFYASVEQRDDPQLRGKPVAVGGLTRGVVAAASYEAREFGVRSAMPMREALTRCPDLLRVHPRMEHYRDVSKIVFAVFREFTPLVEGLSLDEAFLDVTDSIHLFGDAKTIASRIKSEIHQRTQLCASVGVAPNKLVAKIASDLDKPDGLTIVDSDNMQATLDPLPVAVIPGIGPETLSKLKAVSIERVGQLRCAESRKLAPIFGRFAERAKDRAAGIDDRPVTPARADKSISAETTFDTDLHLKSDLRRQLLRLSERTATRLRAKDLVAGTLSLKIRQSDFTTFTRQRRLKPASHDTDTLYQTACELLDEWQCAHRDQKIRLLGVGGSELAKNTQIDMFADEGAQTSAALDRTVDEIRGRFGDVTLARARTLDRDQIG